MPEPPDDFEDELRDGLEGIAGEAAPPAKATSSVLGSARRRVARNAGAAALAFALFAGAVAVGLNSFSDHRATPVPIGSSETPSPTASVAPTTQPGSSGSATSAPTTSAPEPSPSPVPSFGIWTGPDGAQMFVGGVVYLFHEGAAAVVGIVPEDTAIQPPVATPNGVVVLGGRVGRGTHLWLLPPDGGRQLLKSGVDGFGVSADGDRLAYSVPRDGGRTTLLMERSLATSPMIEPDRSLLASTNATVIGYAGDEVVLDTGDGAAARAATWTPGSSTIIPLAAFGRAVATDPGNGFAVLTEGDGRCWVIASISPNGAGVQGTPKRGDGCGIVQASFQPSGDAMAGVIATSEDRSGAQRFLLEGTTSQLGGAADVDGAFQTLWKGKDAGADTVLVLSEPEPNSLAVVKCRVSENLCSGGPVWTATAPGGEGAAWLVEERPSRG
jgi:hypothetical protein